MPFRTLPMTGARSLAVSLGFALSLALPASMAFGAEASTGGSFCDAITVDALQELSPLRFDPPDPSGAPGWCSFQASSPSDSYSLAILTSGMSFDLMRQAAPDIVEFNIGDHPAIMVDGYLHVGLDDGILSIILELDDPDAVPGLDPVAFATGVAELVLPAIDATSTGDGAVAEAALAPPPDVDGIEWGRNQEVLSAQELIEADEGQAAAWQPLADALGADLGAIFILSVNGSDAGSGEGLGNYSAIRVVGMDGSSLRSGIVEWFRNVTGPGGVETEDLTLGGKQVTRLSSDGESRGLLYVQGDTAYAIGMSDDDTARVLETLP